MAPKKDVCELLIQDAEDFARIGDSSSRKKTLFLTTFAVCGLVMAVYGVTSNGHVAPSVLVQEPQALVSQSEV